MRINETAECVHAIAVQKGWWWGDPGSLAPAQIAAKLCLIHSEVSEALEELRDGRLRAVECLPGAKPKGLDIELADVVIRVLDLAQRLGLDIEEAMRAKIAYNRGREYRHGGKVL